MSLRVQTKQYIGNGSGSDRLITTDFALDVGHTLVLLFTNASLKNVMWRSSAGSGTRDIGDPSNHNSTVGGVVALQSGGFTVNNDGGFSPSINGNTNLVTYTALILNDPAGTDFKVGSYSGQGSSQSQDITTGFAPQMVLVAGGKSDVNGTGTRIRSNLFTGNVSRPFGSGIFNSNADHITAFGATYFTVKHVAVSGNINASGGTYEWAAFSPLVGAWKFQHFYGTGTGSTVTKTPSPMANAISIALAASVSTTGTKEAEWRAASLQAGAHSTSFTGVDATTNITDLTPTHIDLGSGISISGQDYYALVFPGLAGIPPVFTSIDADHGTVNGGTLVTITGEHFVDGIIVNFGGEAATDVTWVSETELTCVTPAHAVGAVDVVITNPDFLLDTGTDAYTYEGQIDSVTPDHGPFAGGTPVTIAGAGFINGSTVEFDGVPATSVVVVNSTTITCVTPAHDGIGAVDVEVVEP